MKFSDLIIESKADEFKLKYSKKFTPDQLERIVKNIQPKYFDWVGKTLDAINFDEKLSVISNNLNNFSKVGTNLPKTDINQYKTIDELVDALESYKNRSRRDYEVMSGANLIYDDGRYFVVNPLTHDSSCYFGSGTKWCTAASTDQHFQTYNDDGKLFYILDRTKPTRDSRYKIAILKKFDGDVSVWDATDERIKSVEDLDSQETYSSILKKIDDYLNDQFPEQMKIFSDERKAKLEKERLARMREERRVRGLREQANERRINNEWELGPNCPQMGLKAHAVLQYLQEEETNEEIDLYNIIPIGDFYRMTSFEVIDSGLEGMSFMCGDEYDTKMTAFENALNLIEDVGVDGFNHNFLRNFIDKDEVASWADDFYSNDIWENPEGYLNPEDRLLSAEQKQDISINRKKIQSYETAIEQYQNQINDENRQLYEKKINEFNESISELQEEIELIEADPEGDYDEDRIEEVKDDRIDEVKRDPLSFINEFGLDLYEFIDKRELARGVIESDGYGNSIGTYDGEIYEYDIEGEIFYVGRID